MFKNITIGQYVKGDSFLHRMDPRVKILLTIFYIVILFLVNTPLCYVFYAAFTLFLAQHCPAEIHRPRAETDAVFIAVHCGDQYFHDPRRPALADKNF